MWNLSSELLANNMTQCWSYIFRDITQCSLLKVNWYFRGTSLLRIQSWKISRAKTSMQADGRWLCLPLAFITVSCLAYYLILMIKATYSSETSVNFKSYLAVLLNNRNEYSPLQVLHAIHYKKISTFFWNIFNMIAISGILYKLVKWQHFSLAYNWAIRNSVASSANESAKDRKVIIQRNNGCFNKQ
jgi:hypothetical protein